MASRFSNEIRGVFTAPLVSPKETRMGIFTYLKIGAAVVILAVCGYYIFNYEHMKTKIAAQQIQIDNLKLEQDVLAKKQKTFDDYLVKKGVIKKRVNHEEQKIDQTVDSGDVNHILDMFHQLHPDKISPPAHGGTGRAKPAPGREASP